MHRIKHSVTEDCLWVTEFFCYFCIDPFSFRISVDVAYSCVHQGLALV